MTDSNRILQVEAMADYFDILVEFADTRQDHVLAAKLTDARERFAATYLAPLD